MENLTVTLPPNWNEFINAAVAAGGYRDAAHYIEELLREAEKRQEFERMEKLVEEGLQSGPAVPWTDEDWSQIRKEVHEYHARQTGNGK